MDKMTKNLEALANAAILEMSCAYDAAREMAKAQYELALAEIDRKRAESKLAIQIACGAIPEIEGLREKSIADRDAAREAEKKATSKLDLLKIRVADNFYDFQKSENPYMQLVRH
jgi:hypothetical protein